ncbi:hypothetical protein CsSME_00040183 [Camellia sinensis var. sinensis]
MALSSNGKELIVGDLHMPMDISREVLDVAARVI